MSNQPQKWINHQAHAEKIVELTRQLPDMQREIIYRRLLADKSRRLARTVMPAPFLRSWVAAIFYAMIAACGIAVTIHGGIALGLIMYLAGGLLLNPCLWDFMAGAIERQAATLSASDEVVIELPAGECFKVGQAVLAEMKARPEVLDKDHGVVVGKIGGVISAGSTLSIKFDRVDDQNTRCTVYSVTTNQHLLQTNKQRVAKVIRKLQESVAIHQLLLEP